MRVTLMDDGEGSDVKRISPFDDRLGVFSDEILLAEDEQRPVAESSKDPHSVSVAPSPSSSSSSFSSSSSSSSVHPRRVADASPCHDPVGRLTVSR